jgi:F-type H+-transporting ATPase subunit beta
MIPVGNAVLGRVLNAHGEPIDSKGDLTAVTRIPLYTPDTLSIETKNASLRMLETGIKVIDLMAPAFYGSTIEMIAETGMGRPVVAEEIMHTFMARHQAIPVIVGMSETAYDASSLRDMVREIEVEDRVVMLFEQITSTFSTSEQLLYAAMTIAAHFEDHGREILLIIDEHLATQENIANVRRFAAAKSIASIVFLPMNESSRPANGRRSKAIDVQLQFSQTRAKQSLWPAIDPVASHSRLLESDAVSMEHRQVAQQVRDVLQRYYDLRKNMGNTILSEEDQRLLARGERIDLFFTQPFVVAEAYTDLPGTYLTIEETIRTFHDLLNGRYDATPMQAFNFVGSIKRK